MFLGLSKISSLLTGNNRDTVSEPIFEKSTKLRSEPLVFRSSRIFSSESEMGQHFGPNLSIHPLVYCLIFEYAFVEKERMFTEM